MPARATIPALLTIALAVLAAPAQASFTDVERIAPFTPTTSEAKSLTATGLKSVTVNALEDEGAGTSQSWSVTAYAICAPKPAGLQRVAVAGTSSSTDKVVTASCPVGKSVIGMAGTLNSPNGQVVFDSLFPNTGLTTANIAAAEDATGNSANWSLTAYAICAATTEFVSATLSTSSSGASNGSSCPAGYQVAGVGGGITRGFGRLGLQLLQPGYAGSEVVAVESVPDSAAAKSVTAACPAGKRAIGAGGTIGGPEFAAQRILTGITPNSTLTTVTAAAHEDEAGYAGSWSVVAFAVCAPPPAGLQRVSASSALGSDEFSTATAACPAGKHVIGIGGSLGGDGEVLFDDLKTDPALSTVTTTGFEDSTGFGPSWNVTAYAICVNY